MIDTVCLKMGCQLEYDGLHYWGDLHQHPSGALIFNAVCWDGEAAPQDQCPNVHSLTSGPCTWERRGVFVLCAADCSFNAPLTKHLAEAAHARVW